MAPRSIFATSNSSLSKNQQAVVHFSLQAAEILLEDVLAISILRLLLTKEHAVREDVLVESLKVPQKLLRAKLRQFPPGVVEEELAGPGSGAHNQHGGRRGTTTVDSSSASSTAVEINNKTSAMSQCFIRFAPQIGHFFGDALCSMVEVLLAEEEENQNALADNSQQEQDEYQFQQTKRLQVQYKTLLAKVPRKKSKVRLNLNPNPSSRGPAGGTRGGPHLATMTAASVVPVQRGTAAAPAARAAYRCAGTCTREYGELDVIKYISKDGTKYICPQCGKHELVFSKAAVKSSFDEKNNEIILNRSDLERQLQQQKAASVTSTGQAGTSAATVLNAGARSTPRRPRQSKLSVFHTYCGGLFKQYCESLRGITLPYLPRRDPNLFRNKDKSLNTTTSQDANVLSMTSALSSSGRGDQLEIVEVDRSVPFFLQTGAATSSGTSNYSAGGANRRRRSFEDGFDDDEFLGLAADSNAKRQRLNQQKPTRGYNLPEDDFLDPFSHLPPLDMAMRERNRARLLRARKIAANGAGGNKSTSSSTAGGEEERTRRIKELLDEKVLSYENFSKKIALRYVTAEHEGKMTDAEYEAYFEQKQQALNLHYGELFAGRF
ncbi:unnamed protein product [Amoebophrya sp. A120]|nr:unnamed protein product [Amoebophrya sp. A120]|eukprot:GSA120T00023549001.1